ncbi:hypothetical protein ABK046_51960, partial [Streptomyces caeruleatus]
PTLAEDANFWRKHRLGRVIMGKEGIKLNLNQPLDMLKYLILMSNPDKVAPSYDDKDKKATYEFMVVDESKVVSKKIAE